MSSLFGPNNRLHAASKPDNAAVIQIFAARQENVCYGAEVVRVERLPSLLPVRDKFAYAAQRQLELQTRSLEYRIVFHYEHILKTVSVPEGL